MEKANPKNDTTFICPKCQRSYSLSDIKENDYANISGDNYCSNCGKMTEPEIFIQKPSQSTSNSNIGTYLLVMVPIIIFGIIMIIKLDILSPSQNSKSSMLVKQKRREIKNANNKTIIEEHMKMNYTINFIPLEHETNFKITLWDYKNSFSKNNLDGILKYHNNRLDSLIAPFIKKYGSFSIERKYIDNEVIFKYTNNLSKTENKELQEKFEKKLKDLGLNNRNGEFVPFISEQEVMFSGVNKDELERYLNSLFKIIYNKPNSRGKHHYRVDIKNMSPVNGNFKAEYILPDKSGSESFNNYLTKHGNCNENTLFEIRTNSSSIFIEIYIDGVRKTGRWKSLDFHF